ncbi:MAG: hypothetical protein JO102_02485, partial [Elusimicrobia bacterium]|nr:hypothetical protein [Elusimicrobiota bacterium]
AAQASKDLIPVRAKEAKAAVADIAKRPEAEKPAARATALRARALALKAVVDNMTAQGNFELADAAWNNAQASAAGRNARALSNAADAADAAGLDTGADLRAQAKAEETKANGFKSASAAATTRYAGYRGKAFQAADEEYHAAWGEYREAQQALERAARADAAKAKQAAQPTTNPKLEAQRRAVEGARLTFQTHERAEKAAAADVTKQEGVRDTAINERTAREGKKRDADAAVALLEKAGAPKTSADAAVLARARATAAQAAVAVLEQQINVNRAEKELAQLKVRLATATQRRVQSENAWAAERLKLNEVAGQVDGAVEAGLEKQRQADREAAAVAAAEELRRARDAEEEVAGREVDDIFEQVVAEALAKTRQQEAEEAAARAEAEEITPPPVVVNPPADNRPAADTKTAPRPDRPRADNPAPVVADNAPAAQEAAPIQISDDDAGPPARRVAGVTFVAWFLGITGALWGVIIAVIRFVRRAPANDAGTAEDAAPERAVQPKVRAVPRPAVTAPKKPVIPADTKVFMAAFKGDKTGDATISFGRGADGRIEFRHIAMGAGTLDDPIELTMAKPLIQKAGDKSKIELRFGSNVKRAVLAIEIPGVAEPMTLPLDNRSRLFAHVQDGRLILFDGFIDGITGNQAPVAFMKRMEARFRFLAAIGMAKDARTPNLLASTRRFNEFLKTDLRPSDGREGARRVAGATVWTAVDELAAADPDYWSRESAGVEWVQRRPAARVAGAPAKDAGATKNMDAVAKPAISLDGVKVVTFQGTREKGAATVNFTQNADGDIELRGLNMGAATPEDPKYSGVLPPVLIEQADERGLIGVRFASNITRVNLNLNASGFMPEAMNVPLKRGIRVYARVVKDRAGERLIFERIIDEHGKAWSAPDVIRTWNKAKTVKVAPAAKVVPAEAAAASEDDVLAG